jgi:hypothetical protein
MRIVSVNLSRLGVLLLRVVFVTAAALFVLIAFAGIAGAQVGAPSGDAPAVVNIFDTAQLIALIGGVVIPFVVALLARANASGFMKAVLAVLSAALLALATYLTDTAGSHTWKGALSVFVIAVVSAAASRVTVTGGADTALQAKTGSFGVG